jgi:type II secretion system protein J
MKIKLPIDDRRFPILPESGAAVFSIGNRPSAIGHGFTLIEMILAIGVAAIVLITISAVFFAALRLRDATQTLVDNETPVDQTMAIMERDLACAVTPTNGTSKILSGDFRVGNIASTGIGEPVSIEMYTATGELSASEPWGDIQRVTYELRPPTNPNMPGSDLIRSVTRNLLAVATPDVEDEWMMGGVQSLTISCYDGSQWWPNWDTTGITSSNTNLPTAVKVDIQFAGNNAAAPIEMVVPIDCVARTNRTETATSTGGTGG